MPETFQMTDAASQAAQIPQGSLAALLTARFGRAFEEVGAEARFGEVVPSQRPELGQFQCNGAMPAAKALKKNPREIAQAVVENLEGDSMISSLSLAGPGFINVSVTDAFLAEFLAAQAASDRLGIPRDPEPANVVVDYGGPNVAKPMHVGHLRSSIIGDAIVRLLRFLGHDVKGDIHLGDWGTQMGMLIHELESRQPDLVYFKEGDHSPYPDEPPITMEDLQEMYPVVSAKCKEGGEDNEALRRSQAATVALQQGRPGYRALWQHFRDLSIAELKDDFARLGIEFDLWYGESDYHDRIPAMVEALREKGVAVEDAGALVVHVEEESDKKPMPPVILLKSDGGTNYSTTDLATIQQRVDDLGARSILYVVDKRQSLHFEQVFRAAAKSGIAGDATMEHLPFGTMNGKDGRPFKTRAGGVMRLKDLIEMMTAEAAKRMTEAGVATDYPAEEQAEIAQTVGMAALKYADLMNLRTADYVFDIERFTRFEGRTGSYLLYAAVRIKSVLRKAAGQGLQPGPILPPRADSERALFLQCAMLPDAIRVAASQRMPHHLCSYAYDLGQAFSRFYTECHILTEEDAARQASLLGICAFVLRQLETVLDLLGIRVPERM